MHVHSLPRLPVIIGLAALALLTSVLAILMLGAATSFQRQIDQLTIIAGSATQGQISEGEHTFKEGVIFSTGYAGQLKEGWVDGLIFIPSTSINNESLIFITPVSIPRGRWWVQSILPGEGFFIQSTDPNEDMQFNWMLMGYE